MGFERTFIADNWHRDARSLSERNRIRSRRWGMRVTVYLTADSGDYVLTYGLSSTNLQDNANWLKVADIGNTWGGGGGGGITTADNGLNLSTATNVQWGGPLIVDTYIEFLDGVSYFNLNPGDGGDPYFDLYMEDPSHFSEIFQAVDVMLLMVDGVSIQLDPTLIDIAANPGNINISADGLTLTSLTTDFTIVSADNLQLTADAGNLLLIANNQDISLFAAVGDIDIGATTDVTITADNQLALLSPSANVYINSETNTTVSSNAGSIDLTSPGLRVTINGDAGSGGQALMSDGAGNVVWDTPGGGGLTADNGLTITTGNIQLGGPLVQNTLINGAGFDLQIGTFVTSPLDSFQSYAASHFWSSRDAGTGEAAGFTLNTQAQFGFAGQGGRIIATQTTAQTSTLFGIAAWNRLGTNTNTPGLLHSNSISTSGTAASGFGAYNQTDIEVSDGSSWIAMQEEITWEVATVTDEHSTWRRLLTQGHTPIEVYKIETFPDILHTISGLVIMPNLPTSSAGLAAGTLWNNSGALNVA